MDFETAPSSGDPETDSLADRRWITAGAPITFGFPTTAAQFTGYSGGEPSNNFEALSTAQQTAARTILASISSFTNLTFTELTGSEVSNAVLRFGMSDTGETAHAYLPSASETGGDSWYNNSSGKYDNPVLGNYAWDTILHELGHALGLIHPHESTPPMPGDSDWMAYTVMSYRSTSSSTEELGYYNETWSFPQSYMIEDIAALQFLYGANYTFNAGDTVYRWNGGTGEMFVNDVSQGRPGGNRVFTTIWDGGGNDTYDFSTALNYAGRIDLRPEAWSFFSQDQLPQLGGGYRPPGNVANAALVNNDPRSLIENAIGTNYDDVIYGNDVANVLHGGQGNDEIYGLLGDDMLYADAGGGKLYGGDGNDRLIGGQQGYGGNGNDTLTGTDDYDQLYGDSGDDWLEGRGGNDNMGGGTGDDHVDGGDGNDVISGDAGDDILIAGRGFNDLYGGTGNDTLVGGDSNDGLFGNLGIDVMTGGLGDDTYGVDDVGDQVNEVEGHGIDTVVATISYVAPLAIENVQLKDWTYYEYGGPPPSTGPIGATGNALDNVIQGNSEANVLQGLGGADKLSGGFGNDVLDGGTGADTMTGGPGDDTYYVDNPADTVKDNAGQGTDTIYSSVSFELTEGYLSPGNSGSPSLDLANPQWIEPMEIEFLVLIGTQDLAGTGNSLANTIQGNSGNNVLNGASGNDIISGGAGNDVMSGSAGTDILTGGTGLDIFLDTAAGLNGDTIADLSAEERIRFTDATLSSFAYSMGASTLNFTGGSLALPNLPAGHRLSAAAAASGGVELTLVEGDVRNDFNGDGRSDMLWRHDSGQVTDWLGQANGSFAFNDANFFLDIPNSWHIAGTGDFNGDGRDDILWRDDSGVVTDWLGQANGSFAFNDANFFLDIPNSWHIAGTGDFNGDGRDDILWRDDSGVVTDWLGQANGSFAFNDANILLAIPNSWHIAGTGDFNGDGRDDILWRDDSGQVTDWLGQANGSFAFNDANFLLAIPNSWHIAGTGDFNGDGRDDILWRDDSGQVTDWLGQANGGFAFNDANILLAIPNSWNIAGTGDFNGDGRDDIAWRHAGGLVTDWLGQANGAFAFNDGNFLLDIPNSWHIPNVDNLVVA